MRARAVGERGGGEGAHHVAALGRARAGVFVQALQLRDRRGAPRAASLDEVRDAHAPVRVPLDDHAQRAVHGHGEHLRIDAGDAADGTQFFLSAKTRSRFRPTIPTATLTRSVMP